MKEKRDKGLCYYCEEKWNPNHKCKRVRLYLMEGVDFSHENEMKEEGNELLELEEEGITVPGTGSESSAISLHDIARYPNLRTMRLMGRVREQSVVILVDTGNTHNFFDPNIVSKSHLALNSKEQIEVRVANGERIRSEGKLEAVEILVQGHVFTIDSFLLPLRDCDIVLGMQWL